MRNRYNKPPCFDAPPRLEQLPDILRDAMLTEDEEAEGNEAEARRRGAVGALLKFARAEVAEARAEAARARARLTEAITRRGVEKADGIAESIARHGAHKANAQGVAEALIRLGVEKPDAHGIKETLAGGPATADAQGIAEAMLVLALQPLVDKKQFLALR